MSRICGTDHHKVKRVLEKAGIPIVEGKKAPFTDEHKMKISKSCTGRSCWSKGKKMSKDSLYKNMATHLRFNINWEWLRKYDDIEKLKFLNRAITCRDGRFLNDVEWYKCYIARFYYDEQFNNIYEKWIKSGKEKYKRPTIDHIIPKAKKGTNEISNLQFLTWFENRSKNDMTQKEWNLLKQNMGEYLV